MKKFKLISQNYQVPAGTIFEDLETFPTQKYRHYWNHYGDCYIGQTETGFITFPKHQVENNKDFEEIK